jgi:hypothetical protein
VVPLLSILCGESWLLILWCVGDRCDMVGNNKDLGRSRTPSAEERGLSSTGRILSGQTIGRWGDAMYGLHRDRETRSVCFLVWPRNHGHRVSRFGPQNW